MATERKPMTVRQRMEAERLLRIASNLQGDFWDELLELEDLLGVRIDETRDLSDWTVDAIYECAEDDVGPICRLDRAG